jgi:hypothetical protein
MFENRRYLILPIEIAETIDFKEVHETSINTVRKSIDGTKTFVKYDVMVVLEDEVKIIINPETGDEDTVTIKAGVYGRPTFYSEEYLELNHSDMLELMSGEEWTEPNNDIK